MAWPEEETEMALLERVSRLIRANLNDLVDRAENPEKMLKQVILDMQNQLMQVKTQVAIAMADQHLLAKKLKENEESEQEWMRKAELAVDKKQEDLARTSIERSLTCQQIVVSFRQQLADQDVQVETLKSALRKLEQKLVEAQAKSEILMSQHRRARALSKATDARAALSNSARSTSFDRMKDKVHREEALSQAKAELNGDDLDERLLGLGREDQIEQLLKEIKARKGAA
jgi:phage shock protein A